MKESYLSLFGVFLCSFCFNKVIVFVVHAFFHVILRKISIFLYVRKFFSYKKP